MPDTTRLEEIVPGVLERFAARNAAREQALGACRSIIRLSANAIRAVHRGDFNEAERLLGEARAVHAGTVASLEPFGEIYFAGFLHDAQKELAEAHVTLALLSEEPLPSPADLGVGDAAWLNGVAESVGELRRWVLDRLRRGKHDDCDSVLAAMDEIYAMLVTIDFPDAMTGGLRRTTDLARGILEKTRGDLTMAIVQRRATEALGMTGTWSAED